MSKDCYFANQLLGSTKTKTSELDRTKICRLNRRLFKKAKYFASDNIALKEYLWVIEEEQLEFNELNLTRRMTFIDHDAEDLDEGEEEDFQVEGRTNTERVEMLLLNFLIGRILINHVIVRPEDCPALGISKSRLDTSTSHGQRIKKNLRMLASLLWQILRRLPGHEDIPEAQNTGHFEEEGSGDKSKKKANDKKDKDKEKHKKMKSQNKAGRN